MSVVCYCEDCQEGSRQIGALPNGWPSVGPDGGTAFVLYRRDRVEYPEESGLLRGYRLWDDSPATRTIATCCGSAMYLDFEKGHRLSVYRSALWGYLPPPEMRVHTKTRPASTALPNDLPGYSAYPLKFMAKLVAARLAMLLKR